MGGSSSRIHGAQDEAGAQAPGSVDDVAGDCDGVLPEPVHREYSPSNGQRVGHGVAVGKGQDADVCLHGRSPGPTGVWAATRARGAIPGMALGELPGADELERAAAPGSGWDYLQGSRQ